MTWLQDKEEYALMTGGVNALNFLLILYYVTWPRFIICCFLFLLFIIATFSDTYLLFFSLLIFLCLTLHLIFLNFSSYQFILISHRLHSSLFSVSHMASMDDSLRTSGLIGLMDSRLDWVEEELMEGAKCCKSGVGLSGLVCRKRNW